MARPASALGGVGGVRGTSVQANERGGSSKQLADQLADFRLRVEKLKKAVNENESDVEAMKEQMSHALADLATLDEILCTTGKRVTTVETNLAEMNDRLNAMGERLERGFEGHAANVIPVAPARKRDHKRVKQRWIRDDSSAESSEESEESEPGDAQKGRDGSEDGEDRWRKKGRKQAKERDNALHDAIRKCLNSIMGICPGGDLPQPVAMGGVYWEYIPSGPLGDLNAPAHREEDSFLRPDWDRSWKVNKKGWLLEVTQRIQRSGHKYTNALSREHLNALSHESIARAVKVVFHTMVKNWRMQVDEEGHDAKKMRNLNAKKYNRKRAKAKARYELRGNVPEAADPMLVYQYQWQYQSTDESEVEDVLPTVKASLDPETDNEANYKPLAAKNRLTRKVWVSHAPAWRLSEVNRILDEIDVHVAKQRNEDKSGRGNTYRFRRRGAPRSAEETKLPLLKRAQDAVRIPRRMVDEEWLASDYGYPYDNRRYISDDEAEQEAVGRENTAGDEVDYERDDEGVVMDGEEGAEEAVGEAGEWDRAGDVAQNEDGSDGEELEYVER
ncbi:hypothetical protein ACG7TL_007330 [Trametes sanguinea]